MVINDVLNSCKRVETVNKGDDFLPLVIKMNVCNMSYCREKVVYVKLHVYCVVYSESSLVLSLSFIT